MIRLLVASDAPLLSAGLEASLVSNPDVSVVATASTPLEVAEQLAGHVPDVVVSAFADEEQSALVAAGVDRPVLVLLRDLGQQHVLRALQAGARGVLPWTCRTADVVGAVTVLEGGLLEYPAEVQNQLAQEVSGRPAPAPRAPLRLTRRQAQVLERLSAGRTLAQTAAELGIRPRTVRAHAQHLIRKTGARSIAELILMTDSPAWPASEPEVYPREPTPWS